MASPILPITPDSRLPDQRTQQKEVSARKDPWIHPPTISQLQRMHCWRINFRSKRSSMEALFSAYPCRSTQITWPIRACRLKRMQHSSLTRYLAQEDRPLLNSIWWTVECHRANFQLWMWIPDPCSVRRVAELSVRACRRKTSWRRARQVIWTSILNRSAS